MSEEPSSHASFLICCLVKQYVLDAKNFQHACLTNMFEKCSNMKLESSCIPQADDAGVHGGAILPHPLPCLRHGWRPGE